jgi:hypothetical protein
MLITLSNDMKSVMHSPSAVNVDDTKAAMNKRRHNISDINQCVSLKQSLSNYPMNSVSNVKKGGFVAVAV